MSDQDGSLEASRRPGVAGSIAIQVNGEPRTVPAGLDLLGLLSHLDLRPETVVVEHNRTIVRRAGLAGTPVHAGDVVEIVHFVGGG